MMRQDDAERVDLNLDEESLPESAAEAAAAAVKALQDAAAASAAEVAGPVLADQLTRMQAEKEALRDTLLRRQADFENYKKRIERERAEDRNRATALLVEGLLPVLDTFERALAAHADPAWEEYRRGLELIYRQLWDVLKGYGLETIPAQGQPFDPHVHHAVERVESSELEEGTVMEEHERGYRLRDKVLRPAMVRVSYRPDGPAADTEPPVN